MTRDDKDEKEENKGMVVIPYVEGFTESLKEIGYQGIRVGDLVIHAMDAFAGAVGQCFS